MRVVALRSKLVPSASVTFVPATDFTAPFTRVAGLLPGPPGCVDATGEAAVDAAGEGLAVVCWLSNEGAVGAAPVLVDEDDEP